MNKIEIFVQVKEEIKELKTVEKVLYSALEKEQLENVSFKYHPLLRYLIVMNAIINTPYNKYKITGTLLLALHIISLQTRSGNCKNQSHNDKPVILRDVSKPPQYL